jgi:hypothetical protein
MKTKIPFLVVSLFLISSLTGARAQDLQSATGIVTTFKTIPLKHVIVTSLKAGESVITDSMGRFSIKCFKKDVLKISAFGFIEKKQKVTSGSAYKIDLVYTDNVQNFNDAISHGYITEGVLKNAVFEKEKKNVKDYSKYKSIYDAIASEIYNVRINGNTIVNTKQRSFDRTPEVLLVVDDKIVSDISFIDTEYVKSIEFIDDVGTAMYGSMGANGVLKIKLK